MSGKQSKSLISISCVILFFLAASCSVFRPSPPLPVFDVLNPGPEVDIVGFTVKGQEYIKEEGERGITKNGDVIVTPEFMVWVKMLEQEIERLREKAGEVW
ncbi:MAG: hypothetical protein HWN68_06500 [Desulfobacterales bacterium]|nr:hypothetical protein [Desulfobacterales bacterium]